MELPNLNEQAKNGQHCKIKVSDYRSVEAILFKEGDRWYILHNYEFGPEGSHPTAPIPDFTYAYCLRHGTESDLRGNGVEQIELLPEFHPFPVYRRITVGDYDGYAYADKINVGCQTISRDTIMSILKLMDEIKAEQEAAVKANHEAEQSNTEDADVKVNDPTMNPNQE